MNLFLLWSLPWLSLNKNDHPRTEQAVHRIRKDHRRQEGGSNLIPTGASIAQRHTIQPQLIIIALKLDNYNKRMHVLHVFIKSCESKKP
jgi:hypothetical protein